MRKKNFYIGIIQMKYLNRQNGKNALNAASASLRIIISFLKIKLQKMVGILYVNHVEIQKIKVQFNKTY